MINYTEINPNVIFNSKITIDKENNLILYKGMVIGYIEYTNIRVIYTITLPNYKNSEFSDLKTHPKDIFSEKIKVDALGNIYLFYGIGYLHIGSGTHNIQLRLPYFGKEVEESV